MKRLYLSLRKCLISIKKSRNRRLCNEKWGRHKWHSGKSFGEKVNNYSFFASIYGVCPKIR
jgi:hypothetical protein